MPNCNDLGRLSALKGKTIVDIREITQKELNDNDWQRNGFGAILVLDDKTEIWAMSDEEGNGIGTMIHDSGPGRTQAYVVPDGG